MTFELEQKIFELKPEWFKDMLFGIECGDGWFDLIEELVSKLVALEIEEPDTFGDFKVAVIKEKFGGLRFYVDFGESSDVGESRRIFTLINSYEHKSFSVCELCGKQARLKTLGYIRTLCRYPHDQTEG